MNPTTSAPPAGGRVRPLAIQWERVRRRWVLVLVIGIVAAAGSWAASTAHGTSYTGRSALTIVSKNRAPGQDAVLAQGYADYFNLPATQTVLRARAGVTDTAVVLSSRIAAGSPIVYVEATGPDPGVAQQSAKAMAIALRDDVDAGLGDTGGTNQLRDLQLDGGVAADPTGVVRNALSALVGGLFLGTVLAAALGRFETRLATPGEVSDRLGLPVLAVLGDRRGREEAVGARPTLLSLAGLTDPDGVPSPGSVTITGPESTRTAAGAIALALTGLRAAQGRTTLLLQTDLEGPNPVPDLVGSPGVTDRLADRAGAEVGATTFSNGALLVSPPGRRRDDVPVLSAHDLRQLLRRSVALADLVVIAGPPADTVEGRIVGGVADRTLLVIEEDATHTREALGALEALRSAGATALGVVLVRERSGLDELGFLSAGPWMPLAATPPRREPVVSARGGPASPVPRGTERSHRTAAVSARPHQRRP